MWHVLLLPIRKLRLRGDVPTELGSVCLHCITWPVDPQNIRNYIFCSFSFFISVLKARILTSFGNTALQLWSFIFHHLRNAYNVPYQVFNTFARVKRDPSKNPQCQSYYYPHFTKEQPEALSCLPKVTWEVTKLINEHSSVLLESSCP